MFYFYILKSISTSEYYFGCTKDFTKRLALHNAGKVRSTKNGRPWEVVYYEIFEKLSDARKRELQVKKWKSRDAVERLLRTFQT